MKTRPFPLTLSPINKGNRMSFKPLGLIEPLLQAINELGYKEPSLFKLKPFLRYYQVVTFWLQHKQEQVKQQVSYYLFYKNSAQNLELKAIELEYSSSLQHVN